MKQVGAGGTPYRFVLLCWLLVGILTVAIGFAQMAGQGWSPEEELVRRLVANSYTYDRLPPSLSLAIDPDNQWHLAYAANKMYVAGGMYGWWSWDYSELSYTNALGLYKDLASTWGAYGYGWLSGPALAVDHAGRPAVAYSEASWWSDSWTMYLITDLLAEEPVRQVIASGGMYWWADDGAPEPTLCFDSQDRWHAAYTRRSQDWYNGALTTTIYHIADGLEEVAANAVRFYSMTGWQGYEIGSPTLSVDADDHLYLGFLGRALGAANRIYLTDRAGGAWSPQRTLMQAMADNVSFYGPTDPSPALVVDSTGRWNLSWVDGSTPAWPPSDLPNYIQFATAGGPAVAVAQSLLMYATDMYRWVGDELGPVALAMGPDRSLHVAYARSTPGSGTYPGADAASDGAGPGGVPPPGASFWCGRPSCGFSALGDWTIVQQAKAPNPDEYWCHIAGPATLAPGDTPSYQISGGVNVADPDAYTWPMTAILSLDLPAFMQYVSDDSGVTPTVVGNHIEWQVPAVPNVIGSFTVATAVAPDAGSVTGTIDLAVSGPEFLPGQDALGVTVSEPEVDLSIAKSMFGPPRRGFQSTYTIQVVALGNTAAPGTWVVDWLPAELAFVSCDSGGVYDPVTHSVAWSLGTVNSYTLHTMHVTVYTPLTLSLGDQVTNTATVGSASPFERNYRNNTVTLTSIVVGSWDPNDKAVSPTGVVSIGDRLTYFIHFENEGTFEATNIRIMDQLPVGLDDSTLMPLDPQATYNPVSRVITWQFDNINLPPGGTGEVSFSACTAGDLSPGAEISNSALIYFDFNDPVQTPVVTTTIAELIVTADASPNPVPSGGTTNLTAEATDTAGHGIASWEWNDNGAGGTFSPGANVQNPTWTAPGNTGDAPVVHTLTLTVTCDGAVQHTGATSVSVTEDAEADTIAVEASAEPATVASGGTTQLTADAVDSRGHGITGWSWSDGGAGGTFLPSAGIQNPTYTAPGNLGSAAVGRVLTVTATCNGDPAASGSADVTVTEQPVAHEIVVVVSADPTEIPSGGTTQVSATATDSRLHNIRSWVWSDGSAGGTFSPSATVQNPTYTAPGNHSGAPATRCLDVTVICWGPAAIERGGLVEVIEQSVPHSLAVTATATPETVSAGGTTTLSAVAVDSIAGHSVTSWLWADNGAGGAFSPSATIAAPTWTAPGNTTAEPVSHTLSVTAICGTGAGSASGSDVITVTENANQPPAQPTAVSPADASQGVGLTPKLTASAFSDPDGNGHAASQWQVSTSATDFSGPALVWDSGKDAVHLTEITVPDGELTANTQYWWRVRYTDSLGGESPFSDPVHFTTVEHKVTAEASAAPETIGAGLLAALSATATDSLGHSIATWAWSDGGAGGTFLPSANVQNPHYQAPAPEEDGALDVDLTVTATCDGDPEASGAATVPVLVQKFGDVASGYWAAREIYACFAAAIVGGYGGVTYRPEGEVTRAQMAVYIARAIAVPTGDAGVPDPPSGTLTFSDVAADHWAYKYVEYCADQDIVQGYPGGAYRPDETVNRGQMSVYVARAYAGGDDAVPADTDGATFTDVTEDGDWAWCYRHVEYCAANGIVQGYFDSTYRPGNVVTRAQMAVYIQRAFELPMSDAEADISSSREGRW